MKEGEGSGAGGERKGNYKICTEVGGIKRNVCVCVY